MSIPWEIVYPNLGWIVTLLALMGFAFTAGGWKKDIEKDLGEINKTTRYLFSIHKEELFEWYMQTWGIKKSNPKHRQVLLQKLRDGTIIFEESLRLKQILEVERTDAEKDGLPDAVMAISALLYLIAINSARAQDEVR